MKFKCIYHAIPFLLLLLFVTNAYGSWVKTYGGTSDEESWSVQQTTDNGFIVAGRTLSFGIVWDIWLLKLDSSGKVQWQKTYGGIEEEFISSVQQTSDDGYIVAGSTSSFGLVGDPYDIWLLKLDSSGNVQWQKTYGGTEEEHISSLQLTSDGGYIVTGATLSFGIDKDLYDIWVLRLDSSGNVQWEKTYGFTNNHEFGLSGQQASDGGYIIAAEIFPETGWRDFLVLKLDSSGNVQWQKTYGGTRADQVSSVKPTSDDGYIVAGFTDSFGLVGDPYDIWLLKLDSIGNVQWQKTYGGTDRHDAARSIQQTIDNGYIIAADTFAFEAIPDIWVLKLDSSGDVQWQKTYGGTDEDFTRSIQQSNDGGYVVTGTTSSFGAGGRDIWVLKLDSNGNISDCDIVGTSNVIVTETTITALNTSIPANDSSAIINDTSASPLDTQGVVTTTCADDGDDIIPEEDNCPEIYNPGQEDLDGDGIGDPCDYCVGMGAYDNDTDGFCDGEDNCPFVSNANQEDTDEDSVGNICDNCPDAYNPNQEDIDTDNIGDPCDLCPNDPENDADSDGLCGDIDNCPNNSNPEQEDYFPPQGNDIGDVCDCESDFDCDGDVDGTDATTFKLYFGRNLLFYPCDTINPCRGDFDCDHDCDGTDASLFKSDFGRSEFNNPCPACVVGEWCVYP